MFPCAGSLSPRQQAVRPQVALARLVGTGVRPSRCRFGEREPLVAEVGDDLQPPIEDFGANGECQRAPDGRASGDVVDFEIKAQRAGHPPAERAAPREPRLGRQGYRLGIPQTRTRSSEPESVGLSTVQTPGQVSLAQRRNILSTDKPVGATVITWHEAGQIGRANAFGCTPVVFVHGLWLLSSSWDRWAELFETAGYVALTPDGV